MNLPRRDVGQMLCNYLATLCPAYLLDPSYNAQIIANGIGQLYSY